MSSNNPLVSVIMNCYNGESFLREAIDSVFNQSYENWEIIFWDNQSGDKSKEIVDSYQNDQIKYFYAEKFTSLGEARNLAIQKSKGELVAFLDVDDIWFQDKLKYQVEKFVEDEQVGIVYCDTIFFNSSKDVKQLYLGETPYQGDVFRSLLAGYNLSLETIVVRKVFIDKLDEWFDPRFNMIEEADFLIRLSKICKVSYVPKVLAKWRIHSSSWTFAKYDRFPIERRQMLDKFEEIYPNFRNEYSNEYSLIELLISKEKAISYLNKSERNKARKELLPFLNINNKSVIYYFIMSFLPTFVFDYIQKLRGVSPIN